MGDQHTGLETRGVEEIGYQSIETVGFVVDRLEQLGAIFGGVRDVGLAKPRHVRLDRREGCSQVVADGVQQGRLDFVRLLRDLCRAFVLRASSCRIRELCGRQRGEHEQCQADCLVGLRDAECPNGRYEEVIVRKRSNDRGDSGWTTPPASGGKDDRQQIQQHRRGHVEPRPQQCDDGKCQRNARKRERIRNRASHS